MKKKRKYQTVQPKKQPEPELVQPSESGPVRVGDIVVRRPVTFYDRDSAEGTKLVRGRVVYVTPRAASMWSSLARASELSGRVFRG